MRWKMVGLMQRRKKHSDTKAQRVPSRRPMKSCVVDESAPLASAAPLLREESVGSGVAVVGQPVEQPFSGNIQAGKNTYVYDAHTYHTKVPPQGIAKLIEYYTAPGQVVLDPFCGSGMTGVAAGNLGRHALLSDLSPAAAFIAQHLNTPIDAEAYLRAVRTVLASAAELENRLYQTPCRSCGTLTPMLYMVWSYGVLCSECNREFVIWDVARAEKPNVRESKILSEFPCPHCGQQLRKRGLKRTRRYPVQLGYKCCGRGLKEQTAELCEHDRQILAKIEAEGVPPNLWFPRDRLTSSSRAASSQQRSAPDPRSSWEPPKCSCPSARSRNCPGFSFRWQNARAFPSSSTTTTASRRKNASRRSSSVFLPSCTTARRTATRTMCARRRKWRTSRIASERR